MASQNEVAAHLRLSDRQIRNLAKLPGAPNPRGRGEYDLDAWRYFYIDYLRAHRTAESNPDEPEAGGEDAEKKREQELKNAERQERILLSQTKRRILARRFAPIEIISVAISRVAVSLRTRVDSWLPRIKQVWPDMPPEVWTLLEKELATASNELADIQPDLSDYDVSDIERDIDRLESFEAQTTDDGGGMG